MTAKEFRLVAMPVPLRLRTNFYREVIHTFLDSGEHSVVVAGTDRKPATLLQGLRKAIAAEELSESIKVVQRLGDVYLTKD